MIQKNSFVAIKFICQGLQFTSVQQKLKQIYNMLPEQVAKILTELAKALGSRASRKSVMN